eukprot:2485044-Pyramimonas_sp.AAC.1
MSSREIIPRGCAMHRRTRQSRASKSTAERSMHSIAWRCVVNIYITKHCNTQNGIAQRHRTEHGIAWR